MILAIVIFVLFFCIVGVIYFDDDSFSPFEKNKLGNNQKKNQEVRSLFKKYEMTKEQNRAIHDQISKKNYTRKEIELLIREFLGLDKKDETHEDSEKNE